MLVSQYSDRHNSHPDLTAARVMEDSRAARPIEESGNRVLNERPDTGRNIQFECNAEVAAAV